MNRRTTCSQTDYSRGNASELYTENHRVDSRWDINCSTWVLYRPVYLCVTPVSRLIITPLMPHTSICLQSMVCNFINRFYKTRSLDSNRPQYPSYLCSRKWAVYRSRYSDWLRDRRFGDRIPVGKRFSAPVQTGPQAHPASYTIGTGSFPGAKRPGRGVHHPPPSSAEVKENVQLFIYAPSRPSWPVLRWTLPSKRKFHNNLASYANAGIASRNRPEPPTPQPVTYPPSMTQPLSRRTSSAVLRSLVYKPSDRFSRPRSVRRPSSHGVRK